MIIELNEKDFSVFDEIMKVLKRYPEFEYIQIKDEAMVSLPRLEIYLDQRRYTVTEGRLT